jgi:hypothetical protein
VNVKLNELPTVDGEIDENDPPLLLDNVNDEANA